MSVLMGTARDTPSPAVDFTEDDDVLLGSPEEWRAAEPPTKRARTGRSISSPSIKQYENFYNGTAQKPKVEKIKSKVAASPSPAPASVHSADDKSNFSLRPPRPPAIAASLVHNASYSSSKSDNGKASSVPPPVLDVSPENVRSRTRARAFASGAEPSQIKRSSSAFYACETRPYLPVSDRERILRGAQGFLTADPSSIPTPTILHVDFSVPEARALHVLARQYHDAFTESQNTPIVGLGKLLRHKKRKQRATREQDLLPYLVQRVHDDPSILPRRTPQAAHAFMVDLKKKRIPGTVAGGGTVLVADKDTSDIRTTVRRSQRTASLLFARELHGPKGPSRGMYLNMKNELQKAWEDGLELRAQWTNCAGDVHTVAWVSNDGFIAGTTNHCDRHNQQYNRPGNLLLGSIANNSLRSYPDHRIPRPIVEKGENSTHEMRESQDPYLYTTVCDSVYDRVHNRAYTCGYDKTVKIWRVRVTPAADATGQHGTRGSKVDDKSRMDLLGTWHHSGNVNFVVASSSGLIATAADVAQDAVRVYRVSESDISASPYLEFSCRRKYADPEAQKWAYCPATIKWGIAPAVANLLLVGYSPRSLTEDPNEIPADKINTGEIALWDVHTGARLKINTASAANVFDVAWHPFHPIFLVGTSPCVQVDEGIRTQIHIYTPSEFAGGTGPSDAPAGSYSVIKSLDCVASDINEIIVRPNSFMHSYVAAGCTDGNVYVWDTTPADQDGDKPLYVLPHGKPVETLSDPENREDEDVGVKFLAWGRSADRLYTGSSDGVVRVWSVRSDRGPRLWDLLEVPGAVTFGAFSPDFSRLVVGDATGRVSLLSVVESDEGENSFVRVGGRKVRRPRLVIPHEEPEGPVGAGGEGDEGRGLGGWMSGSERAGMWLQLGGLRLSRVGAVQGPNYGDVIGLWERQSHLDDDPEKPLLGRVQCFQQEERGDIMFPDLRRLGLQRQSMKEKESVPEGVDGLAAGLAGLDLDESTRRELEAEGAILEEDVEALWEDDFAYEDGVAEKYWGENGLLFADGHDESLEEDGGAVGTFQSQGMMSWPEE